MFGEHVLRLRAGRSAQREHVTELAAYGLTFVAISTLMPLRRVVSMQMGVAPDILFDVTPGALRGVETAGRASGGRAALSAVRNGITAKGNKPGTIGKAATLTARADLAEVHLSLWCASPRMSIMDQFEGRDPPRAAEAWGQVLRARQDVDAPTAEAMLSRITPLFESSQREFASAVKSSPMFLAIRDAGSLAVLSAIERGRTRDELASVLARFLGATSFWWMQYRLAEADERKKEAWEALSRARRLAPENRRFLAMSLLVAAWALPRGEADKHIAPIRGFFDRSGAEVCLMYAFSEVTLARKAPLAERHMRWQRGLDAAQSGLSQVESEGLRRNLEAAQMLLQTLLAGRKPTMDILYLAGLGELAIASRSSADVADVLTASVREAA